MFDRNGLKKIKQTDMNEQTVGGISGRPRVFNGEEHRRVVRFNPAACGPPIPYTTTFEKHLRMTIKNRLLCILPIYMGAFYLYKRFSVCDKKKNRNSVRR